MKHIPEDCIVIERNGIVFLAHPRNRYGPAIALMRLSSMPMDMIGSQREQEAEMVAMKGGISAADIQRIKTDRSKRHSLNGNANTKQTAGRVSQGQTPQTSSNARLRASALTRGFASEPPKLSQPGLLGL